MQENAFTGISLSERMVSAFPLSIGTSLAMESVFSPMQKPYDPERKIPQKVSPGDYQVCYINLATMYRNMVGAMDKQVFTTAHIDDLIATLIEEVGVIQSLFDSEGEGCAVKFYIANHDDLHSGVRFGRLVGVKLREATTDNQKYYEAQEKKCLKALHTFTDSIIEFKDSVKPKDRETAFILTHQPYDLINYGKFAQLDLLESNTGVLKPRYMWGSKYHPMGERDMSHLPFHRKLLFIFGDKAEIKPGGTNIRNQIYDISIKRNWNPTTTLEKINLELGIDILDPALAAIIKSYS